MNVYRSINENSFTCLRLKYKPYQSDTGIEIQCQINQSFFNNFQSCLDWYLRAHFYSDKLLRKSYNLCHSFYGHHTVLGFSYYQPYSPLDDPDSRDSNRNMN